MNSKNGKIIAIVGAPRSGKSFLANLLAEHYEGRVYLEGEELDFPERIVEDIKRNIRPLERILWFRNKLIKKHLEATEHKKNGQIVILDTFWFSTQLYVDALTSGFENELIKEVMEIDSKILNWPDITIFLSVTHESMKKFIKLGGRQFDTSEDFFINQALPINKIHEDFFVNNQNLPGKVIVIKRDDMDFSKKEDFEKLLGMIEK